MAVEPPSEPVYRVAWGVDPFAVRPWETAHEDGTFGNRFDDPGAADDIPATERFRTIYCASQRACAFGEVIARMRPSPETLAGLEAIEDEEPVDGVLEGIVDPEDRTRGLIRLEWQLRRRLGWTYLDEGLRFVDICAAENMALLHRQFASLMKTLGIREIDLSAVTSQHRQLTQQIARYIYEQVDEHGEPLFAGLRYLSRLNPEWECWAIFDRRFVHRPGPSETIHPNDPGLLEAARIFRLTIEGPVRGSYIRP